MYVSEYIIVNFLSTAQTLVTVTIVGYVNIVQYILHMVC